MAITLPTPWAAQEKIKPSRLNGFMSPIQSKFAANIRSEDLAADAGIKGGQISSASGTRITNANLENNAVDSRVIVDGAITTAKILDANVTSAKLAAGAVVEASLGALAVAFAKLKLTTYSYPSPVSYVSALPTPIDTGLGTATTRPLLVYTDTAPSPAVALPLFQQGGTWRINVAGIGGSGTLIANTIKVVYLT